MKDINTIRELSVPIAKQYGVKRLYLFGSYAKGEATEKSDVDILIEKGMPMPLLKLSGMRQSLMEALNLPVDLVTTAGIETQFEQAIADTEVLLYEDGVANHLFYEKKQEDSRGRMIPKGECAVFDEAYERCRLLQDLDLSKVDVNMFTAMSNSLMNDGCGLYRGRLILPYEHLSRFQNDIID